MRRRPTACALLISPQRDMIDLTNDFDDQIPESMPLAEQWRWLVQQEGHVSARDDMTVDISGLLRNYRELQEKVQLLESHKMQLNTDSRRTVAVSITPDEPPREEYI
jgi:hypothetical protein